MRGAAFDVLEELWSARKTFPRFHSPHEGYAILREEVDELWEAVRAHKGGIRASADSKARMRAEAVQVAAMALRFIQDVCDGD